MSADWALLSLNRSAQTMQNTSYLELAKIRPIEGQLILMAGFSRDQQLGDNGSTLTFDPDCQVRHTPSGANAIYTNCTAFKGASGGPVLTLESDTYKVLGVISAGDEAGLSLFTPVTISAIAFSGVPLIAPHSPVQAIANLYTLKGISPSTLLV